MAKVGSPDDCEDKYLELACFSRDVPEISFGVSLTCLVRVPRVCSSSSLLPPPPSLSLPTHCQNAHVCLHPQTHLCTIHPCTLTTIIPESETPHTASFSVHLWIIATVCLVVWRFACALRNSYWYRRDGSWQLLVFAGSGNAGERRVLGQASGYHRQVQRVAKQQCSYRVATVHWGDPSPRFVGDGPQLLTQQLLGEIRIFSKRNNGKLLRLSWQGASRCLQLLQKEFSGCCACVHWRSVSVPCPIGRTVTFGLVASLLMSFSGEVGAWNESAASRGGPRRVGGWIWTSFCISDEEDFQG